MGKQGEKKKKLEKQPQFPMEMSQAEYDEMLLQVAQLSEMEAQEEWLASCRYGDIDIVHALLLQFPSLVEYSEDTSRNTGLHMAAANGHVAVAKLLLDHKHGFSKNKSGNTPLHWAASNGQAEMVNFFTSQQTIHDIDVLEKNDFGRSALTEGFTSQNDGVVKSLLEHDSATEEKLLSTHNQSNNSSDDGNNNEIEAMSNQQQIVHKLFNKTKPLLIRELAIANPDNPFADEDRPDQDTTGLSIWSAALILARWVRTRSWDNSSVLELGSGCGVPGIAVATSNPPPKTVYVTDLNPQTVENLKFNISLNECENHTTAMRMDWGDKTTWPKEKVDVVIGSDLIYQKSLIDLLIPVIFGMVKSGGKFLYVAPDSGRDGLQEFIIQMKKRCPGWKEQKAPPEYHNNPLTNEDDEECFLHFQELSSLTYILYEFSIPEESSSS